MGVFNLDLIKEQALGKYLDTLYTKLDLNLKRVRDSDSQHKGIDLIYLNKKGVFIDEKAQLEYLNTSLPTFTFELSYLKKDSYKIGWLLDQKKVTTHYFLITDIYTKNKKDISKGFTNCSITSVNRTKLLQSLISKGLTETKLFAYEKKIRNRNKESSKHIVKELNAKTEGLLYYSPHLAEKPVNLQLRLNHLLSSGIAKKLYPISR